MQNIAEGSQAAGTSRKMELKLTSVARASLEELRLDYEDFLRQRGLAQWEKNDPRRQALIDRRPRTADDFAAWVRETRTSGLGGQGGLSGQKAQIPLSTVSTPSTKSTLPGYPEIAANGALVLIRVASALLDRQLAALERRFLDEGGFTEKLYQARRASRRGGSAGVDGVD